MNDVYEKHITPNFLHSILTNDSLYNMFKEEYENNLDYFKNISKNTYILELERYIANSLENSSLENANLAYFKRFYGDFILPMIEKNENYIFNIKLLSSLKKGYKSIKNPENSEEFLAFYNYIFTSSKYYDRCEKFLSKIKSNTEKMELADYETLTNFVKNYVDDCIPIDICCLLIRNHIYKYNHIFDSNIVKRIIFSLTYDFFRPYGIDIQIEYIDITLSKNVLTHDISTKTIYIDSILIDTFISGNYVELLSSLFYKITLFRDNYLLCENAVEINTLKSIWKCINNKVEMEKIFTDEKYHPYDYFSEMEADAFIMTLRFLTYIGINLYQNYLTSQIKNIDFSSVSSKHSPKEISEEMKFINRFSKMEKEKISALRSKYKVLSKFYGEDGKRYKSIELINKCNNFELDLVFSYLSTIIPEPIYLVDDIIDLTNQEFKNERIKNFVKKLCKYIFPDMFYYSLDSYILMNEDKISFEKKEYLDELYVRISSIKEAEDTHNFLKSAINAIELMKQKD